MTSNIIITYNFKSEYLFKLCVNFGVIIVYSAINEEDGNMKMKILEETKFMFEHDFQMMNLGSHMTS